MKIRTDFVTNSSSSSYIFYGFYSKDLVEFVKEMIQAGNIYLYGEENPMDTDSYRGKLICDSYKNDGTAVLDNLTFIKSYEDDCIVGFQIEMRPFVKGSRKALSALSSFINLSGKSEEEREALSERLKNLVEEASERGEILSEYASGMTDDINWHFTSSDVDRITFELKGDKVIGCRNKDAEQIHFENFYSSISARAFKDMKNLKLVTGEIPEVVMEEAFSGCDKLESIQPKLWWDPKIRKKAFFECTSLNMKEIQADSIGTSAFEGCTSLETVEIHAGKIEPKAFERCTSLETVKIRADKIEPKAFERCTSLKSVDIGGWFSFDVLNDNVFRNCTSLETVDLRKAENLMKIEKPFTGCSSLKKIYIPAYIQSIDDKAFEDCKELTIVVYRYSYAEEYAVSHGIPVEYENEPEEGDFINYFLYNPIDKEKKKEWTDKFGDVFSLPECVDFSEKRVTLSKSIKKTDFFGNYFVYFPTLNNETGIYVADYYKKPMRQDENAVKMKKNGAPIELVWMSDICKLIQKGNGVTKKQAEERNKAKEKENG